MDKKINIAIISNSHAGTLKQGWDLVCDKYKSLSPTFFAQRSQGLRDLTTESGCLIPNTERLREALKFTSNGLTSINPADYDVFLLFGMGLKALKINFDKYTNSFIGEAIKEHIESSLLYDVYTKVRSVTDKSVFISPNPLRSYSEEPINRVPSGFYQEALSLMDSSNLFEKRDVLLPQPNETISFGYYTDPYYCISSRKLEVGDKHDNEDHMHTDLTHMNENFGVIWWNKFFQHLVDIGYACDANER